jgi:hypothetical protein
LQSKVENLDAMNTLKKLVIFGIVIMMHSSLYSQDLFVPTRAQKPLALGIKGGSYGMGVEIIQSLGGPFVLRGGLSFFPYEYKQEIEAGDGTVTNSEAVLGVFSFTADLQFLRFMYLSAGVLYNFTQIDFDVYPTIPDTQNNGFVSYHLQPNKLCPYMALGFGRSISRNNIVSVGLDIGLAYQGNTSVEYRVTGKISENKLSKWTNNITSGSKLYKFYPMITLMIAFRVS